MAQSLYILQILLYGAYYIVIAIIAALSLFGVYVLTAYGRSRTLSLIVSLIYIVIFMTMFAASQSSLHSIFP